MPKQIDPNINPFNRSDYQQLEDTGHTNVFSPKILDQNLYTELKNEGVEISQIKGSPEVYLANLKAQRQQDYLIFGGIGLLLILAIGFLWVVKSKKSNS